MSVSFYKPVIGTVGGATNVEAQPDFKLVWNPLDVALADGRHLNIQLAELDFPGRTTLMQTARVTLVPEPASIAMLGLGLLGLVGVRRKALRK